MVRENRTIFGADEILARDRVGVRRRVAKVSWKLGSVRDLLVRIADRRGAPGENRLNNVGPGEIGIQSLAISKSKKKCRVRTSTVIIFSFPLRAVCSTSLVITTVVSVAQVRPPESTGMDRLSVVGDQPDIAPPLATDLSPALRKRDAEKAILKVADWELARVHGHYNTDWTMGALYTGFMAASEVTKNPKYRDAMKAMGTKLNWQLGSRFNYADDQVIGQTYLELYTHDHNPVMIAAIRDQLDRAMKMPPRITDLLWWWCDALFMAPPAGARMYKLTGDRAYLDYMNREWWTTSSKLWDSQEHLFSREETYLAKKEANGKKLFWPRGNGWAMAGLVRVLQYMPTDCPERPKFVAQYKEMTAKIVSLQDSEGLWRPGLLDAAAYSLPETSGSAFYTYALAWGVKAWKGLLSHMYFDRSSAAYSRWGRRPITTSPHLATHLV
jgi:rhamnogalacturonyl hydrolase YesR